MPDFVLVAIGVAVGLAVGWFLASSRTRPGAVKQLAETKVRGARAVEQVKQELAVGLASKERELEDLRVKVEQEHLAAAKMQAEAKHAADQKSRLSAELQTVIDDNFREVGKFYEISTTLEQALQAYTQVVEAVETRLLEATKRLREMGISAGAPASVSSHTSHEPAVPEPPQVVEPTPAASDPPSTAIPPQRSPLRTDNALPTRRTSPGGSGRPHATR